MSRPKVPVDVQAHVLTMSHRRCCLCYGLHQDVGVKSGQIAHLDHDPANNSVDNLAFLCLEHHNEYDSRPSTTKAFIVQEIKYYRVNLYESLKGGMGESDPASTATRTWTPGKWTALHDEALLFHTGTDRSQSVVLSVAQGPQTLEEINSSIPPQDISWTETIVGDVIKRGWIKTLASEPTRYELTERGYEMLKALSEIPENIKDAAWKKIKSPDHSNSA